MKRSPSRTSRLPCSSAPSRPSRPTAPRPPFARRQPGYKLRQLNVGAHPKRRRRRMGLLDGKTAIITGSARGIGRATAELFAAEGAQVTINDIDGDIAEQAASEISGETVAVSGDLTKPGACDEVVQKTVDAFGKVDILDQQRRLHLGRRRPQDDRRAVPGDARHPHRGAVPDDPRRRTAHARARQGGARPRARRCSARSSTSPRSPARWATPARPTTRPARRG